MRIARPSIPLSHPAALRPRNDREPKPYGLVPAFLEAGPRNVLSSLWKLDTSFAEAFMQECYTHLLTDGLAVIYQRACLSFVADHKLRDWAAFVLVGPGRPFANGRP